MYIPKTAFKMSIKVITYNLLSDFLNYTNPQDLIASTRKTRTMTLLKNFMKFSNNPRPIICLQEISPYWKGNLELLFINHNYSFFTISYGILGIGIAIPNAIKISNVDYIHIGELIAWKRNTELRKLRGCKSMGGLGSKLTSPPVLIKINFQYWQLLQKLFIK